MIVYCDMSIPKRNTYLHTVPHSQAALRGNITDFTDFRHHNLTTH